MPTRALSILIASGISLPLFPPGAIPATLELAWARSTMDRTRAVIEFRYTGNRKIPFRTMTPVDISREVYESVYGK